MIPDITGTVSALEWAVALVALVAGYIVHEYAHAIPHVLRGDAWRIDWGLVDDDRPMRSAMFGSLARFHVTEPATLPPHVVRLSALMPLVTLSPAIVVLAMAMQYPRIEVGSLLIIFAWVGAAVPSPPDWLIAIDPNRFYAGEVATGAEKDGHSARLSLRSGVVRAAILAEVAALALLLRFYRIGSEAYYIDETITLAYVTQYSWPELVIEIPATQPHLPLYYVLLDLWVGVAGTGEVATRVPSAVLSVALVVALYWLGATLYTPRVGLLAAGISAIAPFQIQYAQWARMYALLGLLAVVATGFAYKAARSNRRTHAAGYLLTTGLLAVTHVYGLFVIAGHAAWLALATRHRWGALTAGRTARLLAGAAALTATSVVAMGLKVVGPTTVAGVRVGPAAQAFPYLPSIPRYIAAAPGWLVGGYTDGVVAAAFGGVIVVSTARAIPWHSRPSFEGWLVGSWLLAPVAAALAVSYVHPIFKFKYLAVAAPALYLGMAIGIARFDHRSVAAGVMAVLVIAAALTLATTYTTDQYRPYDDAAAYVAGHADPDDLVIITGSDRSPSAHYFADVPQTVVAVPSADAMGRLDGLREQSWCVWVVTDFPEDPHDDAVLSAVRETHVQLDKDKLERRRGGVTAGILIRQFTYYGGCSK